VIQENGWMQSTKRFLKRNKDHILGINPKNL